MLHATTTRRLAFALAILPLAIVLSSSSMAQDLTTTRAESVFSRAARITQGDAGKTWGRSLSGPILLVDASDRSAIASQPVPGFTPEDGLFVGSLADSIAVANTAFALGEEQWTMLMWPVPPDTTALNRLLGHELWHRVQGSLGFPSTGPTNGHLAQRDGRYWLTLEFRALAQALSHPQAPGPALDALSFRAQRHRQFPEAESEERSLIMHEGIAQYTGFALSGADPSADRAVAIAALDQAEGANSFIRMFAYPLGAAYGLLLDVRAPGWPLEAKASQDLGSILGTYLAADLPDPTEAAGRYGGASLAEKEDAIQLARLAILDAQTKRYVTGPTLVIGFSHMNVSFDPGHVDVLQDHGTIYRTMTLTDDWGTLRVTGGALIRSDWSGVVVPAPSDKSPTHNVEGEGYTLELSPDWMLTSSANGDGLVVLKRD